MVCTPTALRSTVLPSEHSVPLRAGVEWRPTALALLPGERRSVMKASFIAIPVDISESKRLNRFV